MMPSETFLKWYEQGRHFQYKGHSVFYKDEGEGDVIVFLHGFPTASWDWLAIWDGLKTRYRLIALDMLGYGYSEKPRDHPYSILEQASIHQAFLAQLGINKCHLLAHDIGDNLAQELLAHQGEAPRYDIQSVCLLNGGIFPELIQPRPIQKLLLIPIMGSIITRFYNRQIFGKQFSEVFGETTKPSSDELDRFWALIDKNEGQRIIHKLIQYLPEGKRQAARWQRALVQSNVPLKMIIGLDDSVSGKAMLRRLAELIPSVNVTSLAGIGHYPQVEAPDAVLASYLEFLEPLPVKNES